MCKNIDYNTVVGEQPYKSIDMVGSDSGLGRLLVTVTCKVYIFVGWFRQDKDLTNLSHFRSNVYLPSLPVFFKSNQGMKNFI